MPTIRVQKTASMLPFHDYDPSNFSLMYLSDYLVELHKDLGGVMSKAMTNSLKFCNSVPVASASNTEEAVEEVQALIEPSHVTKPSARQMCLSSPWKV